MFGIETTRNVNFLRVLLITAFAAVLVMGFAFPAFAFSASSSPFSYSGKIVAIDNAAKTLTVQSGMNDRQIFTLNSIASVTNCNRPESFSKLKVGDHVTIGYYQTNVGNFVANEIAFSPSYGMMYKHCS
jgi:hypothetical protein